MSERNPAHGTSYRAPVLRFDRPWPSCRRRGARTAHSQAYPSKVITIMVPAPPGGVTDTLGRMLAQRFSQAWGQQAIVENKAGANNIIAAEYRRQITARWPRAADRAGGDVRGQSEPLRQAALHHQGFHSDRGARPHQSRPDRASFAAGSQRAGAYRLRKAASGRAQLRHLWGRFDRPPEHGIVRRR